MWPAYGREIDNVRAALDWSFSPPGDAAIGVALTAAFAPVWLHLSLVRMPRAAERALDILAPDFNLVAPLERRLHIALGIALILTMGPVERTRTVLAKARQLAESVDDVEAELADVLGAVVHGKYTRRILCGPNQRPERFSEVAQRTGDQAFIFSPNILSVPQLLFDGKPPARRGIASNACLNTTFAPTNRRHRILFHYDQRALARARLARVLCLQGYVDQAKEQARISFEEAGPPIAGFTLCWVLHYAVVPSP